MTDPYPCRLSTLDLVDLLKRPTIFGTDRIMVLDHLGNRYHRRFAKHWQFVRFAKERGLDPGFTTPSVRLDPKALRAAIFEALEMTSSR